MLAGCYTLDLYCDNPECRNGRSGPDQYTAETGATCRRDARRVGWIISDAQQICPACSGKKRQPRIVSRNSLDIDKRIDAAIKDGARLVSISELRDKLSGKVPRTVIHLPSPTRKSKS